MSIAAELRAAFRKKSDKEKAEGQKCYFKETIKPYGLTVPATRKIAESIYRKHKSRLTLKTSLQLAEKLFQSGWFEEGLAGLAITNHYKKEFTEKTFHTFETWADKYVTNWAHCDWLCTDLIAAVIEKYPATVKKLRPWTKSQNRWKRRAAAVSLIWEARKGRHIAEVFAVSKALMNDKDDLVQKGTGWMLREAVKGNEKKSLAFLEKYKRKLQRTTLRYAIERLPQKKRKELMWR